MDSIPFIQYLLPDGRKEPIQFDRKDDVPREVFNQAEYLLLKGVVFEAEVLPTGRVALYANNPNDPDTPLAMRLCDNGPDVPVNVQALVSEAFKIVNNGA